MSWTNKLITLWCSIVSLDHIFNHPTTENASSASTFCLSSLSKLCGGEWLISLKTFLGTCTSLKKKYAHSTLCSFYYKVIYLIMFLSGCVFIIITWLLLDYGFKVFYSQNIWWQDAPEGKIFLFKATFPLNPHMISSLLYFTPKPDPVSMFIFMLYTQQHSAFRAWKASPQCRSPLELPLPYSQYKHTKCHLCCFGFSHKPHRFLVTLCFSFNFQSRVPQVRTSGLYAFSDAELGSEEFSVSP